MIKVNNLFHSYNHDDTHQIKNVNFDVKPGEIFGFLGPSGAGKSTIQNILTGLLELQKGKITIDNEDITKTSKSRFNNIGMSFEQANVYTNLTAKENLDFYKTLFDCETLDSQTLLDQVGLQGKEDIKVKEFSKGMKHRLTFARSMINQPKLWFLDEPTTGLDPSIAKNIKDIIREKNNQGTTVFLTTHNMHIAEELCDRVAFIVDGAIKLIDSPKNLKLQYGDHLVSVEYTKDDTLMKKTLSTIVEEDKNTLQAIIENYPIQTIHSKEASLEEIFIKVTGKDLQ